MSETLDYIKSRNFKHLYDTEREEKLNELCKMIEWSNKLLIDILKLQERSNYLNLNKWK